MESLKIEIYGYSYIILSDNFYSHILLLYYLYNFINSRVSLMISVQYWRKRDIACNSNPSGITSSRQDVALGNFNYVDFRQSSGYTRVRESAREIIAGDGGAAGAHVVRLRTTVSPRWGRSRLCRSVARPLGRSRNIPSCLKSRAPCVVPSRSRPIRDYLSVLLIPRFYPHEMGVL